jgi:hypothetical protein
MKNKEKEKEEEIIESEIYYVIKELNIYVENGGKLIIRKFMSGEPVVPPKKPPGNP